MVAYRIFTLDNDGRIKGPPTIVRCGSDIAAVAEAQLLLDGKAIEVWQEARLVVHLDPMRKE
jgi:hypothetical protein